MLNSSIWPIDAITPGQSAPGSDSNKGLLLIPLISKAAALLSDS